MRKSVGGKGCFAIFFFFFFFFFPYKTRFFYGFEVGKISEKLNILPKNYYLCSNRLRGASVFTVATRDFC